MSSGTTDISPSWQLESRLSMPSSSMPTPPPLSASMSAPRADATRARMQTTNAVQREQAQQTVFSRTGLGRPALLSYTHPERPHDLPTPDTRSGPTLGGNRIVLKLLLVGAMLAICITHWRVSCTKPLAVWLLCFAIALLLYSFAMRGLYAILRPIRPRLQQVLSLALYVIAWTVFLPWVCAGAYLVYRHEKCTPNLLFMTSAGICAVTLLFIVALFTATLVYCLIGCVMSPQDTFQVIGNMLQLRPPTATPHRVLKTLATVVYDEEVALDESDASADQFCAICLDRFERGQRLTVLPCPGGALHRFHAPCIKTWLCRSSVCPLCKASVLDCER